MPFPTDFFQEFLQHGPIHLALNADAPLDMVFSPVA
jgi:hypothetical protein